MSTLREDSQRAPAERDASPAFVGGLPAPGRRRFTVELAEPRYRSRDSVILPAGQGAAWVHADGERPTSIVPQTLAELLKRCQRFRTLTEHLAEVAPQAPPGTPPSELREGLEALVSQGLLESEDSVRRGLAAGACTDPPPTVSSLVVTTCDRPALLERCLKSYIANARHFGHALRFVVADDSRTRAAVEATMRAVSAVSASAGAPIRYVGIEARRRFLAELARERAIPADLLDFALLDPERVGHSVGANRNAALLATLGERLITVDDDTICRVGEPPDRAEELRFYSGHDPTELWFFGDRDAALEAVTFGDLDFVGQHEGVLGWPVRARAAIEAPGRLNLEEMSASFARRARTAGGRVLVTSHGLVGDSGMGMPGYFLGARGATRERLMVEEAYRAAFVSREVVRAARSVTIGEGVHLMMPAVGLDNGELLPPFFPVLGNEDGLFALTLRKCDETACIAHLPWVIAHAPPGRRTFRPDVLRSYRFCFSDLLLTLIASIGAPPGPAAPAARMRHLGNDVIQAASTPTREFADAAWLRYTAASSRFIAQLEACLAHYDAEPAYWARDVGALIDAIREGVARRPAPPVDLPGSSSDDEAWERSKRLVRRFGELLCAWPYLRRAAAELQASGCAFGEEL